MRTDGHHPIADYALGYARRFNALVSTEPTHPLLPDLYLKPIGQIACYWASDGIVIFFFPKGLADPSKDGVYVYNHRTESLSAVAQSYSSNLLKVAPAPAERLRGDLPNLPDLPSDLDKTEVRTGYLNSDILSEDWGGPISLVGVSVAPVRRYAEGLYVKTLESRFHLWSPLIEAPSGRELRQYSWLATDFLWHDLRDAYGYFRRGGGGERL